MINRETNEHVNTLSRDVFIKDLMHIAGIQSVQEASTLFNSILQTMEETFEKGEWIRIKNFGIWEIRNKKERKVKLMHHLTPTEIPARKALVFTLNQRIKDMMNGNK